MASKSRTQRVNDQQKDTGDPDEKVLLIDGIYSKFYHESEDCRTVQESADTFWEPRRVAQRRWLGPCDECILVD